jgi:hypothetical protein
MADRHRHRHPRKQQPQSFFPELIDVQEARTMQPKSTPQEATMTNHVNYHHTSQQQAQQQSMLEMEDDNGDFFIPFDDDDDDDGCDDPTPSSLDDQHRLSDVTTSISMDTHEEILRPSLLPLDGNDSYEQPLKPSRKLPRTSTRPVDVAMAQLQAFFGGGGSTSSSNRENEKRCCSDVGSATPARTDNSSSSQEERKDQPQYPRRIIFGQSHSLPMQQQNSDPGLRGGTVDLSNMSSSSPSFQKLQSKDRADSMPLEGLTRKSSMKKISSIGGKLYQSHSSLGSNNTNGMKREISFGNLEIRHYDVALSDHPSCSYGPPVQLSWEYQRENVVVLPVDSYELTRSPRRDKGDLVLSYNDRRHMLLKQAGYSKKEVKQAMKEVDRVKRERLVTDMLLPASILDEAVEASVDYVKQFFLPSLQQQEQVHLQQHHNDEQPPQEEHLEHKLLQPSFSDESQKLSPCSVTAVPGIVLERKQHNQSATI